MATTPNLLSVAKIWDQGAHNAFTDLLRFDDRWWCTFREAEEHGPSIGTVRVITSEDGADWQSVAVLEEQEVDLRDPKLSVTPDGRLMLVMGGCVYGSGEHGTRSPRIAFSSDGNGRRLARIWGGRTLFAGRTGRCGQLREAGIRKVGRQWSCRG